jgi:hypothetical protein
MVKDILNVMDGTFGVTTDEEFEEIVDFLAQHGTVVSEAEIEPSEDSKAGKKFAELVWTRYRVGSEDYELWYQVRTPYSPQDMACSFGFQALKVAAK